MAYRSRYATTRRRRSSRAGGRRGSSRRTPIWVRVGVDWNEASVNLGPNRTFGTDLLGSAGVNPTVDQGTVTGSTVQRIRGQLRIGQTGRSLTDRWTLGIVVVPKSIPPDEYPNPESEQNGWDWLWLKEYQMGESEYVIESATDFSYCPFDLDIKAQRRIEGPTDSVHAFVSFITSNPTPQFKGRLWTSTLLRH